MDIPTSPKIIDGKRISKASNVRKVHPIYLQIAESLAQVEELNFIKIYNGRICASNELSQDRKKRPITEIGADGIVGVELLIETEDKVIQFYSITSSVKGCGRKIVASVVEATPEDWHIVVVMDYSSGFWDRMVQDYPKILVL